VSHGWNGIDTGSLRGHGPLLAKIEAGEIDPSFVVTHPAALEDAPEMYKKFRDKKDGVIKVVLHPGA
jgi:threonine dehydrogenase-like Zn-dependent dehydrogenase